MPIVRARREHQQIIQQLLRRGRFVYANFGDEDLNHFLRQGCSVLGVERARAWGFACVETETRPPTLPRVAPDRSYIRSIALARGRSPAVDVARLLDAVEIQMRWRAQQDQMARARGVSASSDAELSQSTGQSARRRAGQMVQMSYFGSDSWLKTPLLEAGFTIAERVEFLHLSRLSQRQFEPIEAPPHILLRPAGAGDLEPLTQLDADAFDPFWHFGAKQMMELLLTCRVVVAESALPSESQEGRSGALVGYSAYSLLSPLDASQQQEAHVARLAVHPKAQGSGLGRILLGEALHSMQHQHIDSVLLNTQTNNHRAQQLYHSSGFRSTGQIVPLFVKEIGI